MGSRETMISASGRFSSEACQTSKKALVFCALLHRAATHHRARDDAHSIPSALAEENLRWPEDVVQYAEFPLALEVRSIDPIAVSRPPAEVAAF